MHGQIEYEMKLGKIQQSGFKQKLKMKNMDSDHQPLSFDQLDIQSPILPSQPSNADIQYLLTYVSLKQDQELNLTSNIFVSENKQDTIPAQILCKYLIKNTDTETAQPSQKQTIVSIIDSGIHIVSRIKSLMHQRKLQYQKSKSSVNPFEFFKELFFGKQSTRESSRQQGQKNKQKDQQMKQLKIQSEIKMLLAKMQQSGQTIENGKNAIGKLKYVLTTSLYQRVEQTQKNQKVKQQICKKLIQLDELLAKLHGFYENNSNFADHQVQYQKHLSEIWINIEEISRDLCDKVSK